ncbi:replication protein [Acinetobacter bereziniae]|uniref:replication protein n=1 Tax=Acinetobacter bereziniae TaxID=106648 RepID=UPI00300B1F1F
MNTNLAHQPPIPQGELVQFPKKERQAMSKKEEGFTPLPNFICDEGYLSALSGEAIKCLILLNRHIKGFHGDNKSIGEALVMKLTGFKDKRTVRKNMADLAKFQLIRITKNLGKTTTYMVTFEDRIKPELVTSNDTGALNVVTLNDTSVGTSNVTTTSNIKCHSVKEIYLKENIKEIHTQESAEKKSIQNETWKPDLSFLKTILVQTKFSQRCEEILSLADFNFHLGNFNAHWENKIDLTENQRTRKFAAWLIQEFEKHLAKIDRTEKQTAKTASRNVNDAWGDVQQYKPATDDINCEGLI